MISKNLNKINKSNIQNTKVKCICCDSIQMKSFKYNNYGYTKLKCQENLFNNLEIKCCANCGFSFSYPNLIESDLSHFYNFNYSAPGTLHSVSWDMKFANYKKRITPRAVAQINLVKVFKDINEIKNVLEIGPGEGDIAKYFKLSKRNISYYVYEQDKSKYKFLKKLGANFLEAEPGSFYKKRYSDKFDFTIMSHSLEHFQSYQILKILNDIFQMTKKGGVLLIEVPNENFSKHSKNQNHAPHLSFFNLDSLKKLIEKTNFDILFIGEVGPKIKTLAHPNKIITIKNKYRKFALLVKTFRFMRSIINLIKILFKNLYYIFFSNSSSIINSENLNYGKDRIFLRCLLVRNM